MPRPSLHQAIRSSRWFFLALGVALLGYVGYSLLDAKLFQASENRRLDQALKVSPPPANPLPPQALPLPSGVVHHASFVSGSTLGRIEIHRLKLSVIILEGTEAKTLRRAVGHIAGTALPGEFGNVGIAGHRDTFFRELRDIRTNDEITLTTLNGNFLYRVDSTKVVPPEEIEVLHDIGVPVLTLVTCFPFNYVGAAPSRFIVRAHRVEPGESRQAGEKLP